MALFNGDESYRVETNSRTILPNGWRDYAWRKLLLLGGVFGREVTETSEKFECELIGEVGRLLEARVNSINLNTVRMNTVGLSFNSSQMYSEIDLNNSPAFDGLVGLMREYLSENNSEPFKFTYKRHDMHFWHIMNGFRSENDCHDYIYHLCLDRNLVVSLVNALEGLNRFDYSIQGYQVYRKIEIVSWEFNNGKLVMIDRNEKKYIICTQNLQRIYSELFSRGVKDTAEGYEFLVQDYDEAYFCVPMELIQDITELQ